LVSFFSALENRVGAVDSLLCIGLDPHPEDLAETTGRALRDFCLRLIEVTVEAAAAYKPNAAFFEALGAEGISALEDVIRQVPDGIPVILDVKRGDISSTARAYARAAFEVLKADAVTINPYLGKDAILPFIEDPSKGAFVLCKTSNPGADDLQELRVSGKVPSPAAGFNGPLYQWIASLVREWNAQGNLGLVVGATQPNSLARVREIDPTIWILAPGIGAQGGDLSAALKAGLREDGLGLLVPVSRSISRAEDPRQEARRIRDAINAERKSTRQRQAKPIAEGLTPQQKDIARNLLEIGCIKFGQFTLKSGAASPIYIDLRRLVAHPGLMLQVARAYQSLLRDLEYDQLAALPYAGLPITTAVSLLVGKPMLYPRKEEKSYGTKAPVEGIFEKGERAVVLDDLITTGGSKLEGIEKLLENGLLVKDIVVLIDRGLSAGTDLAQRGYQLHAYLKLGQLLDYYQSEGLVNEGVIAGVERFLEEES
jgi:uridine monophosphate synthetase